MRIASLALPLAAAFSLQAHAQTEVTATRAICDPAGGSGQASFAEGSPL